MLTFGGSTVITDEEPWLYDNGLARVTVSAIVPVELAFEAERRLVACLGS